jgi:hypothetical protein
MLTIANRVHAISEIAAGEHERIFSSGRAASAAVVVNRVRGRLGGALSKHTGRTVDQVGADDGRERIFTAGRVRGTVSWGSCCRAGRSPRHGASLFPCVV